MLIKSLSEIDKREYQRGLQRGYKRRYEERKRKLAETIHKDMLRLSHEAMAKQYMASIWPLAQGQTT